MAQRNIDYGSFPDDPNADAIRTAFEKVQLNFTELYSGLQEQAVLSVNRTPGAGISVNNSTGNVVVSANIAQVRVESTTLALSAGSGSPGPLAVLTQGSTPLVINLPANVTGVSNLDLYSTLTANTVNVNLQLNGNTASFTGLVSTSANVSANNVVIANALTVGSNANISGNANVSGNLNATFAVNATTVNASSNINSATANITGNVNANIVNANYLYGDGSNLTNVVALANTRILNGTSYANISNSGGNLNIVIDTTTRMVVTNGGANINGYANITGNVTAPNFTGNLANGNSSISIPAANGNINLSAGGGTNELVITTSGVNVAGTLNATGNANVANLGTGRVIATGNISATQFVSNIATGTAPLTVTSNTVVANLNADLLDGYDTATAATANTVTIRDANGSITANVFTGSGANLTSIPGANVTGTVANATNASTAGTVTTNAQPNITSVGTLSSLSVTGNATAGNLLTAGAIIGSTLTSNVANGTAPLTVTSTTRVANLNVAYANVADYTNVTTKSSGNAYMMFGNALTGNIEEYANAAFVANTSNGALYATTFVGALSGAATIAGTVTTNAQPNITSVGTLTSLGVNGTVTATSFTANTGVFTGNGSGLSAIAGANVTGTVGSATTAGTVTANAQPNITSVGTLSSLAVTANITAGNIFANVGTINALLLGGTLTTNAQPNITSVGTLSSLAVTANANVGNLNTVRVVATGNISGTQLISTTATGTAPLVVTSTTRVANLNVAYANVADYTNVTTQSSGNAYLIFANALTGNVAETANSAFVANTSNGALYATTFVGALSGAATTAGTVTTAAQPNITSVGTLTSLSVTGNLSSGNANLGNAVVANYFIGDGSLITNVAVAAGSYIINGNTEVRADPSGNVRFTISGNANVITVTGTGANISGYANVTGNLTAANISASNISGNITTSAQPSITSLGTLTGLSVDGVSNLGSNSNVKITGGVSDAFLRTDGTGNLIWDTATLIPAQGANSQIIFNDGGSTYAGSAGLTFNKTTGQVTINGNLSASNMNGANLVAANFFAGTLTTAAQPNITSVGTLISLGVNGTVIAKAFTANTGVFTGNGSGLSQLAGANVTGTVANATYATNAGTATAATSATSATTAGTVTTNAQPNITSVGTLTGLIVNGNINAGNIAGGNIVSANYVSGTLTTSAQPNITSVGTLSSLGVNGTVTASAFTANTGVFTGNGSGLSAIAGANVTGTVANATYATSAGSATTAGAVTTNAQPNITSVGTLTGLIVNGTLNSGNTTVGNLSTAGKVAASTLESNVSIGTAPLTVVSTTRVANLNVANAGYADTAGSATTATTAGTVTTAAQPNITSVGTLTSLSVSGNANVGNIAATYFVGSGSELTNLNASNLASGTVPSARLSGSYSISVTSAGSATTAGTVTTAAQPNITSVGTLTSLTVSGNANFDSNTLFVDSVNNEVGIGTGSPERPLHVYYNSSVVGAYTTIVQGATGGYGAGFSFQSNLSGGSLAEMARITADGESAWNTTASTQNAGLRFYTTSVGTLSEKMRITSSGEVLVNRSGTSGYGKLNVDGGADITGGNVLLCRDTGNVGIGTTAPATKLEVSTNTGTETVKITQTDTTGGTIARLRLSHGSGAEGVLEVGAGYAALGLVSSGPFVFSTNNTERMRIDSSGNIGIGNSVPTDRLSVNGNIVSSGYVIESVSGAVSAAGTVQANATVLASQINVVSTVVTGAGVQLPNVVAGIRVTIMNTSANALLVYPPSGEAINSLAANAAYSQPAGARLDYISTSATQWYTLNATYG